MNNGTVIWENPNPTASMGDTTVNLSQPLTDFEYIGIVFRRSTTLADEMESVYKVDEFIQTAQSGNVFLGCIASRSVSNYPIRRFCKGATDHQVFFLRGTNLADASTINNVCIPTKVIGY